MISFSLNVRNDDYSTKVYDAIQRNINYFKKFNPVDWEEAVHRTFLYAIEHQDDKYNDIEPYIKKLARFIMQDNLKDIPHAVTNEDGEVARNYVSLVETPDSVFADKEEVYKVFKELYLLDKEDFCKLKAVYLPTTDSKKIDKDSIITNQAIKAKIVTLIKRYSSEVVFGLLYDFFTDLMKEGNLVRSEKVIKEIVVKESNFNLLDKIPDIPTIKDTKGKLHGINKTTLSMEIDPDIKKWDLAFNSNCDILKVDIAPYMNEVYKKIYVEKGVNTPHIEWCMGEYSLKTPSGYAYVSMDREKFMSNVKAELIMNLVMANLNTIIAIASDSIYIKPTRALDLDTVRMQMYNGTIIDLPVNVHIKNRKVVM